MLVENQVAILYAAINGFLDNVAVADLRVFEEGLHKYLATESSGALTLLREKKELTEEVEKKLKTAIADFKKM